METCRWGFGQRIRALSLELREGRGQSGDINLTISRQGGVKMMGLDEVSQGTKEHG